MELLTLDLSVINLSVVMCIAMHLLSAEDPFSKDSFNVQS
jgi:hypothetical protein